MWNVCKSFKMNSAILPWWRVSMWKYRFRHWIFQWKQDEEGDLAFVFLGFIAFIKYKEHTLVKFDGHKMADAPKYLTE